VSGAPAELRARSYRFFATLVERGVTPALRPVLAELPPLADHLGEAGDPDEAAARHYRLFHHEVQPVASVFLERSGRVGGEVTRAAAHGAEVTLEAGLPADHLVVALRALARGTEADEAAPADAREPRQVHDIRSRRVLEDHLLWWLPLWGATVVRYADPFWRAAVRLLVDAVLDHAVALPVEAAPEPPFGLANAPEGPLGRSDGPTGGDVGSGGATGLGAVAGWLATPVRCGLHLGPSELRRLSRDAGAPAGFGDRRRVVRNLLRSAARYDALPGVAQGIARVLEEQEREVEARVPGGLAGYLAPWRERWRVLRKTLDALAEVGGA